MASPKEVSVLKVEVYLGIFVVRCNEEIKDDESFVKMVLLRVW